MNWRTPETSQKAAAWEPPLPHRRSIPHVADLSWFSKGDLSPWVVGMADGMGGVTAERWSLAVRRSSMVVLSPLFHRTRSAPQTASRHTQYALCMISRIWNLQARR